MKDNYDFSKMRKVPHPLLGKGKKFTDNVGGISDEEFKRKLQDLEPNERDTAIRLRKRRRPNANVSVYGEVDSSSILRLLSFTSRQYSESPMWKHIWLSFRKFSHPLAHSALMTSESYVFTHCPFDQPSIDAFHMME